MGSTAGFNSSIQSELFEPSTYLQEGGNSGYFAVLWKDGTAIPHQVSYPLAALAPVVETINPTYDTWISQATFVAKNRRAVSLRDVGLLFADLDTYHIEGLRGVSPEAQANALLSYCALEGLPQPSVVLYSGRGLQAKWLLDTAVSRGSILQWNEVQKALVHVLEGFGADRNARDVSRVLRLEKTVNTKSGELVRVVHVQGGAASGGPVRYDFDYLAEILLPRLPCPNPNSQDRGQTSATSPEGWGNADRAWLRLEDIRTLWKLRGGVVEGFRELTLFWSMNFLMMASPVPLNQFWYEAQALASEIYPGDFYRESDLSTVYRKAFEYRSGARVIYNGRQYPPLYTPRNETLAEAFGITSDEEPYLKTIISDGEKVRRRREKRWAEGVRPWSESAERTRPWEAFGISRRTWYRRGCPLPASESGQ